MAGALIFASGCDGTESELPNKDWVPSTVYGPSCHCHFAGPGVSGAPEEKGGR